MTDTQNASLKLPAKSELAKAEFTKSELNNKLLLAAREGQDDKVNELIIAGADVNAIDESGKTPLILAAKKGHDKVINALLNSASLINPPEINQSDNIGNTALMLAAKKGRITAVIALLKSSNIALDQVNDVGETALDKASQNSYNGIVNALRRRGATLSDESKTPSTSTSAPTRKAVIFSIPEEGSRSPSPAPAAPTPAPAELTTRRRTRGPGGKCCTLI